MTEAIDYDGQGLEVIGAEESNVMFSEDGRRVWVCTRTRHDLAGQNGGKWDHG